ncbi:MAG: hypothetical protein U1E62_07005 [Alsobacter sp.]
MLGDAQIRAFLSSIAAFMVIVSVHVVLLHVMAALVRKRPIGSLLQATLLREIAFVVQVVVVLFGINLVTNLLWGSFIAVMGVVPTFRNALFYALENYTSLGLTRVQVDETWRTLAPLISLSGVFCLGWSTAILVSLFSQLYTSKTT